MKGNLKKKNSAQTPFSGRTKCMRSGRKGWENNHGCCGLEKWDEGQ